VKKARILIVDDEPAIRRALYRALTARDYQVELAVNGEEALSIAHSWDPDLIVLDLNLPDVDGITVCRRLTTWSAVPIVVLSVREDESDKVEALDAGAEDYLTKPFGVDELLARVRVQLRRVGAGGGKAPPRFDHDGIVIDLGAQQVTRDAQRVRLTKTEWALLETLATHPGKLLTHDWLLERVWGPGYAGDLDVLRVFISQLRRKVEPDPARPSIILTEPGVGYRWALHPASASGP
jgi:two-component system, OmpR family, KDP operon response regulator KdpE